MPEDADQPDARLPQAAGGWTILDVLSDDASGKRFLVQCKDGSSLHLVEPPESAQSALAFRQHFKEKVGRARARTDDYLVPTLGFAEDAGRLYLAEPDAPGVPLADLMRADGALELDAVLEVGADVARGLDALHRHRLVHGGVRPAAVLVADDRARLREAGLVHPKGETLAEPAFASPEQLSEDRSLRPESDLFSLGSTLFAAAVGRPPFPGDSPEAVAAAIREGRPSFPGPDDPPLPRRVARLFAKLLAADPELRPRSAAELIEDLDAVRRGDEIARPTVEPPETPRTPPKRPPKRRRLVAALVTVPALLLAAALALPWLLPAAPEPEPLAAQPGPGDGPAVTTGPAAATRPAGTVTPPREPTPAEQAAAQLRDAEAYAAAYPDKLEEIVRRFRTVAERFPGTEAALRAERKATQFDLKKSGAELAEFADVQARADGLVKEQRFGDAIEVYRRHEVLRLAADGKLPAELRDKLRRQISFVRTAAAQSYERRHKQAAAAVQAERYQEAVDIYEDVAARYGLDEYVQRARRELALLRPLLAGQDQAAAARRRQELEQAYRETAAEVRAKVRAFDLEGAVAASETLAERLKGSALEANAARHLRHVKRLLELKRRIIRRIHEADPKLKSETLGIRAPASVIESADADGITLRSAAGTERRTWAKLSDWETYALARKVSNTDSRHDLTALGLLSLEQDHRARALRDLRRAKRFGAKVDDLLARAEQAPAAEPPKDDRPARMLVQARAHVAERRWLDALVLLIPLKEKHAQTDYAVRAKLDEINALLVKCRRGLARADLERDIAAGIETPLLADGIAGWEKRGKGWTCRAGRVTCDNKAGHDVDLVTPVQTAPAYRLSVRCRVLAGSGLMIRVASDGDAHYDLWLEPGDPDQTGLLYSEGGKVRKHEPLAVRPELGAWTRVRAIVTGRTVRVECAGKSCSLPAKLASGADAKRFVGFITRQTSQAEFEDLRLRVLREQ
jgi:hypothetical protein